MKRLLKYLGALLIVLVCIYGFWIWLQYKGATVVKQTTASIMTQLQTIGEFETVKKSFSKTIEGDQQAMHVLPDIGIDQVVANALFKDEMVLEVQGEISAGYLITTAIKTGDVHVSPDGTVTIALGEAQILGITLTGTSKNTDLDLPLFQDKEMERILKEKAGSMMIQEALSGNVLQLAKSNAEDRLQTIFLNAGIQIKEVIITPRANTE